MPALPTKKSTSRAEIILLRAGHKKSGVVPEAGPCLQALKKSEEGQAAEHEMENCGPA
jgi:hypothetical protein